MKNKIITRPTRASELVYEDFYQEVSQAWEKRARELQARRWEKIRQREKRGLRHV